MLSKDLLDLLVCPETKQALRLMSIEEIQVINQRISQNLVRSRKGDVVSDLVSDALLREDGLFAYPVRDDIPIMLIEEAFDMSWFPKVNG